MKTEPDDDLIVALQHRFSRNMRRHPDVAWSDVLERLQRSPAKLKALLAMEESGGEPDVIGAAEANGAYLFFDCATESPAGRRSLCYDTEGWRSRSDKKPAGTAVDMAAAMRVSLLTEVQYRMLQQHGEFDLKTSSWIATPADVRGRGGALFCDRRYGKVFVYHNGAQSYYGARGFRSLLAV